MKIVDDQPSGLSALDRPNSYIGRSVPRPNLARLTQGRGQYVTDVTLPRMVHVAFVRSPHAHARITSIDTTEARKAPGVVAVVTGAELAKVITPWVGVLTHLKGIKSAPQHAIAVERACWQGEAVCAVVARTRAQAEDACALIEVDYEVLPAVTDAETALDAKTPVIHPAFGDNLTFERTLNAGEPEQGFGRRRYRGRDDIYVRPPYRRDQRAARHRRRLESGRRAFDRLSRHAGTAHDAEPVRQAPRSRGAVRSASSPRMLAARSASRCTSMPTRWRRRRWRNY